MSDELRQEFDAVVDWARWMTTSPFYREPYYRNAAIRQATDKMRLCLAFEPTVGDGVELARRALHRLREEYPEENEYRRAVGWLTYFVYSVCSAQVQPKEASSAVAMGRACLPLLAIAHDEISRSGERGSVIMSSVSAMAPKLVLSPYQSDASYIPKFQDLLRSNDKIVQITLYNYRELLKKRLWETLYTPTDAEIENGMEDYIWDVLSRVRQDASIPRALFDSLGETDLLRIYESEPLWRLFFLHTAFLPRDEQNQIIRESAQRMESWEPVRVRDSFYTALSSLRTLYTANFIGEPIYQHFETMFRYRMLPVLGKFAAESPRAGTPTMKILEDYYSISPYRAIGLFAWDRILSGDPPPYIHQAHQLLHESLATALCAGGLDESVFD